MAAITFDDGYANNINVAKPILARFAAPATMFLMTGGLDTQGYWWDRLERIIMKARALPPVLSVSVSERTLGIPTEGIYRREVYLAAWKHLRVADVRARDEAVDTLGDTLGVLAVDMELRPATTAEVEECKGSILSVGAHTHDHPSLPSLGPASRVRQIVRSREICQDLMGTRVPRFAYPFGDFDERVHADVANASFMLACTTVNRAVRPDDDCLALPRVTVCDWGAEQFMRALHGNA